MVQPAGPRQIEGHRPNLPGRQGRAASEQMLEWAARGPEWRMGVEVCLATFEGKRSAAEARKAFEAAARKSGMLVER